MKENKCPVCMRELHSYTQRQRKVWICSSEDCSFRSNATDLSMISAAMELAKAVVWERECEAVAHWRYEVWEMAEVGSGDCEIYTVAECIHGEARAEVDRLLGEK